MNQFIKLKKSNCKNCYKCIRNCPVKSIRFSNNQANIIPDECVLCGMCFVSCPQNAKEIRNDVPKVKELMQSGKPVYASVAPSFIAEYPVKGFNAMRAALKQLGFADAEETAIGAYMVKKEYEKILNKGEQDIIISTCCHTVNTLVQKYYPEILPCLADVLSPMLAHCKLIKQQNPDCATVFIGPCISKKEEAQLYGYTDAVLTFEELGGWFKEENVAIDTVLTDGEAGGKLSRFFPTTGGILKSMDTSADGYSYLTVDGIENCKEAFEEIKAGNIGRCFIEMSACEGSCINGPAISRQHRAVLSGSVSVHNFAASVGTGGADDFIVDEIPEMSKNIDFIGVPKQMPGEQTIKEILAKIGKTKPEDELNCGCCGYATCREKAIAVYMGKADLSMCLPYLKEKAESFSDTVINNTPNGIFILDEGLIIQQINKSACELLNIKNADDAVGQPIVNYLDPTDYMDAIQNGIRRSDEIKKSLPHLDKIVAETIVYDKEYHLLFSIMRDITQREAMHAQKAEMRTKTAEITDKVIEKQMRIVQEIASLLGETTAETKIALTQLKDTIQ